MSSSPLYPDAVFEEQAALWAARLDGDNLDALQRTELDAWLAQHPAHRLALTRYCQFSADLEKQLAELVSAGAVTTPSPPPPVARSSWKTRSLAGGLLAAAAAVAVIVSVLRPTTLIENFAMAPALRGSFTLADGTRVELNANTHLRFESTKTERRVRLGGGEALFTVTKDPARPFFVETPTGTVRVRGTVFNVRAEPSAAAFEVTVVEGRVEVHPGARGGINSTPPVLLGASERLSAQGENVSTQTLTLGDLNDTLAWRAGRIIFHDTPLGEALARYGRYHGRSIQVAPAVAAESIGGRYSIEDLSGFLHGIEATLPVRVSYDLRAGSTVMVGPLAPQ